MSAKNQPSIQPNSSKCWQENTSTRKKPCAAWAGFAKSHGSGSVLINEQTAPFLSLLLTGERPKGLFHVKKVVYTIVFSHDEQWIHWSIHRFLAKLILLFNEWPLDERIRCFIRGNSVINIFLSNVCYSIEYGQQWTTSRLIIHPLGLFPSKNNNMQLFSRLLFCWHIDFRCADTHTLVDKSTSRRKF